MPPAFEPARRVGFDIRLRPVRRLGQDMTDPQTGRVLSKGREVDAFRLEVIRRFPQGWADPDAAAANNGVTRQTVYTEWLIQRLGGCGFRRTMQHRRIQTKPCDSGHGTRSGRTRRVFARNACGFEGGGLRANLAKRSRTSPRLRLRNAALAPAWAGASHDAMLKGRLGLETARIPHANRSGLLWLSRGALTARDGTLSFERGPELADNDPLKRGHYAIPFQGVSMILLGPGLDRQS